MRLRLEIGWKRMPSNMGTICRPNQSIWMRKSTTSKYAHPAVAHHDTRRRKRKHRQRLFDYFPFLLLFPKQRTKCCYGLSMDLLDNVATELGFEFHLYVVRDQLFGAKKTRTVHDHLANGKQSVHHHSPPQPPSLMPTTAHSTDYKSWSADRRPEINHADDTGNREYTPNGVNGSSDPLFSSPSRHRLTLDSVSRWNKAIRNVFSQMDA